MEVWEPAKQFYLDHTDPMRAAAYRKQRGTDEAFQQRGLLAGNPLPPDAPSWAGARGYVERRGARRGCGTTADAGQGGRIGAARSRSPNEHAPFIRTLRRC